MTDPLWLAVAFAAGLALGLLYFFGLWLTVRGLPRTGHPALLLSASLLGRTAAVLAGFYLLSGGGWPALTAAVAGFIAGRMLVIRGTRPPRTPVGPAEE